MKATEKTDARLIMIGDTKQLQAVEAGRMFSILQETGKLKTVRMSEVQRQKDKDYKETVKDISEKRIDRAFERLERKDSIHEIADRRERLDAIVKDYTYRDYKNSIIVTARNADRNELNHSIRNDLKEQSKLNKNEHTFIVRESKNIYASKGVNFNQAYVAMTRGKEDLKIYTDSKEQFKEHLKQEQTKTSTLDYEKSHDARSKNDKDRHTKSESREHSKSDNRHSKSDSSNGKEMEMRK
ncbi:MAG: AAA family ATPase [Nitrospirae bacterium]|nr:AAA family ATPase [Nitrospirota bacterium]